MVEQAEAEAVVLAGDVILRADEGFGFAALLLIGPFIGAMGCVVLDGSPTQRANAQPGGARYGSLWASGGPPS